MPQGNDDWNSFDWATWGAEAHDDDDSQNGRHVDAHDGRDAGRSDVFADLGALDDGEEERGNGNDARESGHWVRQGGVISWEDDDEETETGARSPRAEAQSVWAEDDLDMPPGAPDHLRVRAAHAWIVRQRSLEEEAIGLLLLERRRMHAEDEEQAPGDAQERRETEAGTGEGPLDLALTEHQAALEAYDLMLGALDDITAHTGPAAALVEFYLWLTEELARLAMAPEAPADFAARLLLAPVESEEGVLESHAAPTTPHTKAQWQGRAEAAAQARKRVEQVSALDPED